MTEDELARLLGVARRRPLIEAQTVRRARGRRSLRQHTPAIRERLEAVGRERVLGEVVTSLRHAIHQGLLVFRRRIAIQEFQ
jgi:hypothetical protein